MILIIECLFHFTFLIINFEKKKLKEGNLAVALVYF